MNYQNVKKNSYFIGTLNSQLLEAWSILSKRFITLVADFLPRPDIKHPNTRHNVWPKPELEFNVLPSLVRTLLSMRLMMMKTGDIFQSLNSKVKTFKTGRNVTVILQVLPLFSGTIDPKRGMLFYVGQGFKV